MHKYILAFCIGLELFTTDKAKSFKLNLVYLIIFAMMSPLGIGLGIAVTTSMAHGSPAYDWTVGILQALVSDFASGRVTTKKSLSAEGLKMVQTFLLLCRLQEPCFTSWYLRFCNERNRKNRSQAWCNYFSL